MKLTLIRGLPGSGKSTLAKTLDAVHLEADMFFMSETGEYHYQPSKIKQAHAWCQSQAEHQLRHKRDLLRGALTKRYGAELQVLVCEGDYGNIHGVDRDTIERMKSNWQD